MMKYKLLIPLALSIATITACNKSDALSPPMPDGYVPSTTPISFQTVDNWGDESKTKGIAIDDFNDGDTFSVLGYYSKGGVWNTSTATPNFMYNQEFKFDGTNWNYSPVKYFPNNEVDKLYFFAYAPHTASITASEKTTTGYPNLTYTPVADDKFMSNATKMVDFMTATSGAEDKSSSPVELQFKHQLAQLHFSAYHDGEEPNKDGTETGDRVKITAITIEKVYPHNGIFTDNSFEWGEVLSDRSSYKLVTDVNSGGLFDEETIRSIKNNNLVMDKDGYYQLTTSGGSIMMSPQKFSNTDDGKLAIGVEFELIKSRNLSEGGDEVVLHPVTTVIYEPLDIEAGMIYNLRFMLSVTGYNSVILGSDIIREKWKTACDMNFDNIE